MVDQTTRNSTGLLLDDFRFEVRRDFDDYFYLVSKWKGSKVYADRLLGALERRFAEDNLIQEKQNELVIQKLEKFKKSVDEESITYAWSQTDLSDILDEIMSNKQSGENVNHESF